ncbi:hypothetical protein EYC84_011363 [Monilinia fructicola]|uniref:Uncharacterized protein n=1 Tax=Monilinia fructicola TaxID=38448 RepID=A0A5M9JAT6_MONFR|nr:hypothetical protein EYC84_011363 [Monilinia fructicola]
MGICILLCGVAAGWMDRNLYTLPTLPTTLPTLPTLPPLAPNSLPSPTPSHPSKNKPSLNPENTVIGICASISTSQRLPSHPIPSLETLRTYDLYTSITHPSIHPSIQIHYKKQKGQSLTSTYINIHINIHQHTSTYIINIHQHTSTYINIHQHTSTYINIKILKFKRTTKNKQE